MTETSKKLAQSLLSSVEQFLEETKRHYNKKDDSSNSNEFSASRDGFDFFEVKNTILCSYLIDITHLISLKLGSGDTKNSEEESITRKRLHETRVILEKIRPMDKKMAYQTKKLLSFADESSVVLQKPQDDRVLRNNSQKENPLSFGPKPDALLARDDDDEASGEDETKGYHSEDDDQDDDLKAAAIASTTTKAQTTNTNKDDGIYKAPRITSVEYLETRDRIQQEKLRVEEKRRQRMKNSELLQTLRSTFGDTPEEDDVDGGAAWKTSTRARVLSEKEAERTAYEEEAMVRFTVSRKEKKERNRILHEEKSNLRALSDFGNLTAGISAFVESNNGDPPDDFDDEDQGLVGNYDSGRHANGRRKRRDDDVDGDYRRKAMRGRTSKKRNEESNLFYGGKKKRNKR